IVEDNILTNEQINNIINRYTFFNNLKILNFVLLPLKKSILLLESNCATLGDCYLSLAKSAAAIKKLPIYQQAEFRRYCFNIINKRFKEFDDDLYLLGYFLTPNFRIGTIWQKLNNNRTSGDIIAAHLQTIAKLCTFYNSELLKILKQTNIKTFEKTLKKEGFDKEKLLLNDDLESNLDLDSLSEKNNEKNQNFEPEDYDWNPEDLLMDGDD
ncbi:12216_t:CDS:2, partial [Gigaspora rosea]